MNLKEIKEMNLKEIICLVGTIMVFVSLMMICPNIWLFLLFCIIMLFIAITGSDILSDDSILNTILGAIGYVSFVYIAIILIVEFVIYLSQFIIFLLQI